MSLFSRVKRFLVGDDGPTRKRGSPSVKENAKGTQEKAPGPRGVAKSIARALLAFRPPPSPRESTGKPTIARDWDGFPRKDAQFIERTPNAFLFGLILDRMVEANQAWLAVCRLKERLGHLDVARIADMKVNDLAAVLGRWRGEKSLHRFPPTMAKNLIFASRRLEKQYHGDASRIWSADPGAKAVRERLREFDGISVKLANMGVRLLVTNYGVKLSDWEDVDIAVDRHVARVFLRTGLLAGTPGRMVYRAAEVREEVTAAARRLSPEFPAALDDPGFFVGKEWCTAERAWCTDGNQPCPLARVCPRDRRTWSIKG